MEAPKLAPTENLNISPQQGRKARRRKASAVSTRAHSLSLSLPPPPRSRARTFALDAHRPITVKITARCAATSQPDVVRAAVDVVYRAELWLHKRPLVPHLVRVGLRVGSKVRVRVRVKVRPAHSTPCGSMRAPYLPLPLAAYPQPNVAHLVARGVPPAVQLDLAAIGHDHRVAEGEVEREPREHALR